MRIFTPVLAAVSIFAFSSGAHVDVPSDGGRNIVRGLSVLEYGDLDIATEQGARLMFLRIERAAAKACGGHPTLNSRAGRIVADRIQQFIDA